MGIDKGAII